MFLIGGRLAFRLGSFPLAAGASVGIIIEAAIAGHDAAYRPFER